MVRWQGYSADDDSWTHYNDIYDLSLVDQFIDSLTEILPLARVREDGELVRPPRRTFAAGCLCGLWEI